jgi:hypothetical protein
MVGAAVGVAIVAANAFHVCHSLRDDFILQDSLTGRHFFHTDEAVK